MKKVIFAINTTLDGVVDHMKIGPPDQETGEYFVRLTREAGTWLYGRKTYQLMVPYWPDMAKTNPGNEFAQAFNAVENIVVFSRSLDKPEGKNTRIVRTNLQEEVLKLKQEQGKDIFTGGVTLSSQLAALGLIDEYHFAVHPIIAGEGRRLFEGLNLQEKLQLKIAESTVFKSGAVVLRYLKQ